MQQTFTDRVYAIARTIPKGSVVTYKQLATLAGSPNASRAAGLCMKHNPDASTIPCHRVVASDGKLVGYAFGEGVKTKKALLLKEGVAFRGEKVDLAVSQWQRGIS